MRNLRLRRGSGSRWAEAARDPLKNREQVSHRPALCHVVFDASGLQTHASRSRNQLFVLQAERADDHLGGSNELADTNHGRVGKRRRWRQLQPLERGPPFFASERLRAKRVQIVGQDHGGGFAQPEDSAFARDVFERDDEHAAGRGLDRQDGGEPDEPDADRAGHAASSRESTSREFDIEIVSTQDGLPVPRHATTAARSGSSVRTTSL